MPKPKQLLRAPQPQQRIYDTLLPPPIETLTVAYLTPLLGGLRVVTRLPPMGPGEETLPADTFIRVEASTGYPVDGILYNMQAIIHSYAPYNDEVTAEANIGLALAWMGNAQGTTITANNYEWFVTWSMVAVTGRRINETMTSLSRYTGAAQWRLTGQPIAPPGEYP